MILASSVTDGCREVEKCCKIQTHIWSPGWQGLTSLPLKAVRFLHGAHLSPVLRGDWPRNLTLGSSQMRGGGTWACSIQQSQAGRKASHNKDITTVSIIFISLLSTNSTNTEIPNNIKNSWSTTTDLTNTTRFRSSPGVLCSPQKRFLFLVTGNGQWTLCTNIYPKAPQHQGSLETFSNWSNTG